MHLRLLQGLVNITDLINSLASLASKRRVARLRYGDDYRIVHSIA
jgi:hypothetical protein